MATLPNILKNKNGVAYDYSLSHHQLLFNVFIFVSRANMEIFFLKASRMIFLPPLERYAC